MKKIFFILFILFFTSPVFSQAKILTLKECIDVTLKNNLQIKVSAEKLQEAKAKIKEAKANKFFTLGIESTYTRLNETPYMDMSKFPSSPFTFYNPTGVIAIPGVGNIPITLLQIPGVEIQKSSDYLINTMTTYGQNIDVNSQGILSQILADNYVMKSSFSNNKVKVADDDVYNAKITLRYPVYTSGRVEQGIKLAKQLLKLTEYEYQKTKQEIILNVKKAYFGTLQAKHFVDVAQAAVNSAEEHLAIANNLYKQGMIAKYDVLRAKVGLADTKQMLITAKNALNLAKAGLALTLGPQFEPEEIDVEDIEIADYGLQIADLKLEHLINQGWENRPEILQLNTNIEMAKNNIKLTKANNKPVIALVGNYDYKKGDSVPAKWNGTWNATLALSFPFFDSGITSSKIKQIHSQINQARNSIELLKQGIAFEVRNSYLELISCQEKIETAKKSIEQAEEGLRIANERYINGIGTQVEVTDARTSLVQAKTNYYNAVYEYFISYAKLEKAVGIITLENSKFKEEK